MYFGPFGQCNMLDFNCASATCTISKEFVQYFFQFRDCKNPSGGIRAVLR